MERTLMIQIAVLFVLSLESIAYCRPSSTGTPRYIDQENLIDINLAQGKQLNVSNKRRLRLFSPKSNKYLQVKPKVVNAKGDSSSKYIDLIIESVSFNLIRIRGEFTQNYICFDPRTSKLKARENGESKDCMFREEIGKMTGRTIYTSFAHPGWSIGIKNNGKPRPGKAQTKVKKSAQNNTFEFTTIVKYRKQR